MAKPSVSEPLTPTPANLPALLLTAGCVLLLLEFALPANGLIGLPIIFFLKNRLHLSAQDIAAFNLWASVPLYLSFIFGFIRDRWSPFSAGDRGHLVTFGLVAAGLFAGLALVPPTYGVLLTGVVLAGSGVLMASSAARGLTSALGQGAALTGLAGSIVNLAAMVPSLLAFLLGGQLSQLLEGGGASAAARTLFLVGAGLMLAVAAFGALGPRRLLDARRDAPAETAHFRADLARLIRHRPIYPALAIYALWQFSPALGTAMQFHLTGALHATDAQVGQWYALFFAGMLPIVAAYSWLCRRVKLRTLLWLGAALGTPQYLPFLFAHDIHGAFAAAIAMGLLGGLAQAAYVDLAIRSCPPGLQGTMMMLLVALLWLPTRFSDLWGAYLYDKAGGFLTAVTATTGVYALILLVLLIVPKDLTSTTDAAG